MAGANLPAKKYKKTTPTQLRLVFEFPQGQSGGFIDLAQALSTVNRRFYRQGLYYYVNSMEVETLQDGYVQIEVAPDTWMTQQAWKRGFRVFQEMNKMVDTPRPKYHDFKVFLDVDHRNNVNGGQNNIPPIVTSGIGTIGSLSTDDWDYSQFVNFNNNSGSEHPNAFNVHLCGGNQGIGPAQWQSVGLISSYADSRAAPINSGEPVLFSNNDDDPITLLFQGSDVHALEEIAQHLDEMNDQTPYDADVYVGESTQANLIPLERLYTSGTPSGRTHKVSGACIPFGLMRVSSDGYDNPWRLVINVAAGTYHGVYAERV